MWRDKMAVFYAVSSNDVPIITHGITVHDDLSMTIYVKVQKLPLKAVKHVCPSGNMESVSQSLEVWNILESKYCELVNSTSCHSSNSCLEFCADILENALPGLCSENGIKISFVIEQIRLCVIDSSRNRRYSQAGRDDFHVELYIFISKF